MPTNIHSKFSNLKGETQHLGNQSIPVKSDFLAGSNLQVRIKPDIFSRFKPDPFLLNRARFSGDNLCYNRFEFTGSNLDKYAGFT